MTDGEWWHEELYPSLRQSMLLKPLFQTTSAYQRVVVAENDVLGRVLILDGVVQVTERDSDVYHEMMTHVPLCAMPQPAEGVLIIGGGDGCMLREVLAHPEVSRVVIVELDPVVIDAARRWLNRIHGDFDDPRVQVIIGDGCSYVHSYEGPFFNVTIVDSPDPIGPARCLYAARFYRDVKGCTDVNGVVVCQAGVPFYQLDQTRKVARLLRRSFQNLMVYRAPVPTYIGGSMAFVLATDLDWDFANPLREHVGHYYNPKIHTAAFALPTWWHSAVLDTRHQGGRPPD